MTSPPGGCSGSRGESGSRQSSQPCRARNAAASFSAIPAGSSTSVLPSAAPGGNSAPPRTRGAPPAGKQSSPRQHTPAIPAAAARFLHRNPPAQSHTPLPRNSRNNNHESRKFVNGSPPHSRKSNSTPQSKTVANPAAMHIPANDTHAARRCRRHPAKPPARAQDGLRAAVFAAHLPRGGLLSLAPEKNGMSAGVWVL